MAPKPEPGHVAHADQLLAGANTALDAAVAAVRAQMQENPHIDTSGVFVTLLHNLALVHGLDVIGNRLHRLLLSAFVAALLRLQPEPGEPR